MTDEEAMKNLQVFHVHETKLLNDLADTIFQYDPKSSPLAQIYERLQISRGERAFRKALRQIENAATD